MIRAVNRITETNFSYLGNRELQGGSWREAFIRILALVMYTERYVRQYESPFVHDLAVELLRETVASLAAN